MLEALYNCRIYTGLEILSNTAIIIENGVIADLTDANKIPDGIQKTNLEGLNLAPSLIDLQIYGGNGKLFSNDLSVETLKATAEYCLEGGASHFMITMATDSIEKFLQGVEAVRAYWKAGGKGLLGLHLEGPFINVIKKGAHIQEFILKPTKEILGKLFENGTGAYPDDDTCPGILRAVGDRFAECKLRDHIGRAYQRNFRRGFRCL